LPLRASSRSAVVAAQPEKAVSEDPAAQEALHRSLHGDRRTDADLLHRLEERATEASDDPMQVRLLGTTRPLGGAVGTLKPDERWADREGRAALVCGHLGGRWEPRDR
jgi:hypothetical protein